MAVAKKTKKNTVVSKKELVEMLAEKSTTTKKNAEENLNNVLAVFTEVLAQKSDISIFGFGSFKIAKRKARVGKNPATGEAVKIPAKTVVTFKPAKVLKEKVNAKATRAKRK